MSQTGSLSLVGSKMWWVSDCFAWQRFAHAAVCQRKTHQYFDFLPPMRQTIGRRLFDFMSRVMGPRFQELNQCAYFQSVLPCFVSRRVVARNLCFSCSGHPDVWDAYVDPDCDRVYLVDISPWGMKTDPLLCPFEDCEEWAADDRSSCSPPDGVPSVEWVPVNEEATVPVHAVVRLQTREGIVPRPYERHRMPHDVAELLEDPADIDDLVAQMKRLHREQGSPR